jgi:dipeptidyl aminopeptidase/acylaminoacyl peptidase
VQLGRRPGAESTQRRRTGRSAVAAAVAVLTVGAAVLVAGPAESADRHGGGEKGRERSRRFRGEQGTETGRPAGFVAERGGRIVVVSAETGRVERYLTAAQPGGGAEAPALSPDGRSVWFSRSDGSCAAHLASVPVAGGKEEKLPGSGEAGPEGTPLPRPDRPHIAYSRADCHEPTAALIVGDLAGIEGHGQLGLAPLAWSRDGRRLLASAADGDELRLLEVGDSGAIVGNEPLGVVDNTKDCRLQVIGFSPDQNDGYVALRRCGVGGSARRTLVLLDRDGHYRRTVVRLPRGVDFLDRPAFDPTGHSLLYSTAPAEVDQGSDAGDPEVTLWLWRDGETRTLARQSGYRHPSWLP